MRKINKITVAAAALALSVVFSMGSPVEAASSKYVTVVNTNKKTSKKSVEKVQITSPAIKSGKLTIYRGTKNVTIQLRTKVTVKGKNVTSKTKTYNAVNYKSSAPSVVAVSSTGKLTAKKNGTATITVSSAANSKKKATVKVTVKAGVGSLKSTVNKKTSATIQVGKTAKITNAFSNVAKGAKKDVTYTSSNKKVATVSSKGTITAKAPGTATITITPKYATGVKATIKVTVPTVLPTSITPKVSSVTLNVGGTSTVGYTVNPATTTNKAVTFSTSNASVAKVDANTGKVTAVAPGTATITITSKAKSSVKATVTIKVNPILPTGIKVNQTSYSLALGQAVQLTAYVTNNATDKTVTFTSSNPNVVRVDTKGKLTTVAAGTATITVAANANPKVKTTVTVKVNNWGIAVAANADNVDLVGTNTHTVTLTTKAPAGSTVTFASDRTDIATVDAKTGKVTAKDGIIGTAQITVTATLGTVKRTTEVLINVVPRATQVTLSKKDATEFTYNNTITLADAKATLDKVNAAIKANAAAIQAAGLKTSETTVVADGVAYVVRFDVDALAVSVVRDGKPAEFNKETVTSLTVKLPSGQTVNSLFAKYAAMYENVQFMMKEISIDCNVAVGAYQVTNVGFSKGFLQVTMDNNTTYKAFVKDGNFFVVGDQTKNDLLLKLVDRGIMETPVYVAK